MKKLFALLCTCTLLGCSSASSKKVDLKAVSTGIAAIQDAPAMMEMDQDSINNFLSISAEDYTEAACYMPLMNVTATEVILFQYDSDSQKEKIQKGLDQRLEELENTWSQYLPAQYELVKNRTSIDADHVLGYCIGEDDFVKEVTSLITKNTK
ncbi:MAG: DUF4358 domain-containing protein [Solobacterium sp.]|jgi:hypothetical protein|nr:DUF4358 domain-containing protein [Solobacterium sp.]MCH4206239.1 DUF4358 domain-containing protein [Solobacterium sp.]MCH4227728.1 DUF4358 domain-containing protein [Solobacterium sp.]MCH4283155.1 DUF4358 domain-containing protein [Solobacterium sp.]